MIGVNKTENKIHVITKDVGGGFGPKAGYYPEEALIAIASKELRKPVKWTEDRREHFISTNQQRDQIWKLEVAFKKNGEITALKGHVTLDSGAFLNYGLLNMIIIFIIIIQITTDILQKLNKNLISIIQKMK